MKLSISKSNINNKTPEPFASGQGFLIQNLYVMTKQRKYKSNPFLISEQVKSILHAHGLSKVFNYSDYECFKRKAARAFNRAQEIADLFIEEHKNESDLTEYIF